MPAITLAQAEEMLALCLEAERAILLGHQEYSIADRTYKRVDLEKLAARSGYWQNQVDRLTAGNASDVVFRPTRVIDSGRAW